MKTPSCRHRSQIQGDVHDPEDRDVKVQVCGRPECRVTATARVHKMTGRHGVYTSIRRDPTSVTTSEDTTPYTYEDLVRLTGIPYGTIRVWVNRGKVPEPTGHLGQSPIWDRSAIDPWLRERGVIVDG